LKTLKGGLALGLLLLAGCSGGPKTAANDPYAGLTDEIHAWKAELVATDPSCKVKAADQKCVMFDVACKAERVIAPEEQAHGVTAKLVADMTWSGFDDKGASQPASAAALFVKANGAWSHSPYRPVNPDSCADL
jgi:hypothetical protein